MKFAALLFLAISVCAGAENDYVGRAVCAGCHRAIAATQAQTAMALTWQQSSPRSIPVHFSETHAEGPGNPIQYRLDRNGSKMDFRVQLPGENAVVLPVEITMGGRRHGLSFLARLSQLGETRLEPAPLIETRYLHDSPENRLELSPGFPKEKPTSYETAFGRVLMPHFEEKCLACHGAPRQHASHADTGVSCESCHGPGQPHLAALARKTPEKGILNPDKLPGPEQMKPCAQCHAGFSNVQDPLPDDLLISDQVTALRASECWRQSGGRINCTGCHNPHQDAPRTVLVARSEKTCLSCHNSSGQEHAALCPVNRTRDCVSCHMPDSDHSAPFVIADHWIRVHPEQKVAVPLEEAAWRATISPQHLYLRMIVLDDAAKAAAVEAELRQGGSFFDLARANSIHSATARNGGYLGDLEASELNPVWAKSALALAPGEISGVVSGPARSYILQRMPRNFREEANKHFERALELRKSGERQQAIPELLAALKIDPQFLRALTQLAISYGEAGNPQTSAGILNLALRYYPQDAGAHFNLAIAYGAMGRNEEEIAEYKNALAIDPDYVPAYLNWGASLFSRGRYDEAVQIYREGIRVNPLVAALHYSVSLALERTQKSAEAQAELALAKKIDPRIAEQK